MSNLRLVNNIQPGSRGSLWRAGIKANFDGLHSIAKRLSEGRLETIMIKAMGPMLATAKALCPVSQPPYPPTVYHGALRDTIRLERLHSNPGVVYIGLKAGNIRVYYGPFVEFGRDNIQAQPFLRPAWDEHKESARIIIREEVKLLTAPSKRDLI